MTAARRARDINAGDVWFQLIFGSSDPFPEMRDFGESPIISSRTVAPAAVTFWCRPSDVVTSRRAE
jgi:hypothetical protein